MSPCVKNKQKVNIFYFHNSCTGHGDHLILLIKSDNVHKQRMLLQAVITTFKKCSGGLKHSQN